MKEKKLRKKLRKKAVKLARFAKRHGFDYLDIGAYVRVMPSVAVYCDMGDGSLVPFHFPLDGEEDWQ